MADIVQAVIGLTALCFPLYFLGRQFGSRPSVRQTFIFASALVLLLVGGLLCLKDRLVMVQYFPHTGAVVWSSSPLPMIALLAGILTTYRVWSPSLTRVAPWIPLFLLVGGVVHAVKPFLDRVPVTELEFAYQGVVRQTSDYTCSAASAATLLRYYGIQADEREMAELSFTRANGTAMLGTYRALRLKTEGTGKRVEVLSGATVEELRQATQRGPVLISVGLPRLSLQPVDPRYERDWGWTPGLRHTVVVFGFLSDGRLDVGDPAAGRERWKAETLDILWNGEGLRLVDRLQTPNQWNLAGK
jgi:predicted double-glycine peptidase